MPLRSSRPWVSRNPRRAVHDRPRTVTRPTRSHCQDGEFVGPDQHRGVSLVTTPIERFVGIDVSKDCLDAHLLPEGTTRRFDNTPAGITALVAWLQPLSPTLVVLEATGGYERPAIAAVSLQGLPVSLVN